MTEKEFLKLRIKPYMEMNYNNGRADESVLCLVVGVDFDERAFILCPFNQEFYDKEDFFARCENCSIPEKNIELKLVPKIPVNLSSKIALKPNANFKHLR